MGACWTVPWLIGLHSSGVSFAVIVCAKVQVHEAFPMVGSLACVACRHVRVVLFSMRELFAGGRPTDLAGVIFFMASGDGVRGSWLKASAPE